jgi:hypothetical protein
MAASHKFKPLKERMANMKVKKVEIERLTVTSSKPFEAVVAALKAAVGQPDIAEFIKETRGARTFSDLERGAQNWGQSRLGPGLAITHYGNARRDPN